MIGTFSTGTGVGLGDTVLNDLSPGFENNGKFLRFTAPDQLIAMRGARLLSPDGSDKPIVLESDTSGPSYYNAKTKKVFVPFEFPTYGIYPLIDNATPKQFSNDKDGITIDDLNALEAADLQGISPSSDQTDQFVTCPVLGLEVEIELQSLLRTATPWQKSKCPSGSA